MNAHLIANFEVICFFYFSKSTFKIMDNLRFWNDFQNMLPLIYTLLNKPTELYYLQK